MNSPEVQRKVARSDRLLAALEAHLRLGFSVVLVFEDLGFSMTGVSDTTADVVEGRGVDLTAALRRFLQRAAGMEE